MPQSSSLSLALAHCMCVCVCVCVHLATVTNTNAQPNGHQYTCRGGARYIQNLCAGAMSKKKERVGKK